MNARPAPELDAGALQRYLAEAVWLPSVLVAGPGIAWQRLARQTAIATIRDGPASVSLQFTFGESGKITQIFTPARYRSVGGDYVPTPWLVRCWDYVEVDGFRRSRANGSQLGTARRAVYLLERPRSLDRLRVLLRQPGKRSVTPLVVNASRMRCRPQGWDDGPPKAAGSSRRRGLEPLLPDSCRRTACISVLRTRSCAT